MTHAMQPVLDSADAAPAAGAVTASVNYLVPPLGRNTVYVASHGGGESRRTGQYVSTPVSVHDARRLSRPATLDDNGFALSEQVSGVGDFLDDDEVRNIYYPEMRRLVQAVTGAREVVVFDHNVRIDGGVHAANSRVPVRNVHNDYTENSAPRRVQDLLGAQRAAEALQRRFAIVNAWRSIEGVVETAPLGLVDAASVRPADLIPTDLVYPERVGEIYEVAGNPAHRWYHAPHMTEREVLLIKGYDSDPGVARFTPHSAFDDPRTPAGAPPRKSIEIRSLVFY